MRFVRAMNQSSFLSLVEVLITDREKLVKDGGIERALYGRGVKEGIVLNEMDYAALISQATDKDLPEEEDEEGSDSWSEESVPEEPEESEPEPPEEEDPKRVAFFSLLEKLSQCRDYEVYEGLSRKVTSSAIDMFNSSYLDDCYHAILLFWDQGELESGRSELQRDHAFACLRELASGGRLSDLIRRACAPDPSESIRASQVLLRLGEHAVPRLLGSCVITSRN